MHIGLLGASFDPPHLGHVTVAEETLKAGIFDQVRWVPTKQHPLAKELTSVEHRLKMVELTLEDLDDARCILENCELERPEISYSFDTLEFLSRQEPEHTFSWIIGSDNLSSFHRWSRYQEILANYRVYVYPRPDYPMVNLLEGMVPLAEVPEIAISSTQVRRATQQGASIDGLVVPAVAQYITAHELYRSS